MLNKLIFGALFIIMVLMSCKNTTTSDTKNKSLLTIEESNVLHNHEGWTEEQINSSRLQAADVWGHRVKNSDESKANILHKDMWHVIAVLRGSDVTFGDVLRGAWFKFSDKNTYQIGSYDEVIGGGRYHYDVEKSTLLLIDNDPRMKPQEFNLLVNNNAIVFVGEPSYKDNNMQAKLEKFDVYPAKTTPSTE